MQSFSLSRTHPAKQLPMVNFFIAFIQYSSFTQPCDQYLVEIMGVKLYKKPFVYKEVGLARLNIVLVNLPSSTNEVIER